MDATHSSKEKSNLLSSKELLPRNAAAEKNMNWKFFMSAIIYDVNTSWSTSCKLSRILQYLIFCLGIFLILNQSPPKGKLISLWKSVSFKGNFFDHYENVPIHKLGWPSVKLCRRQPRWKKRSSAIMNTKIFWINIKQAIIWKHSNQFWIKVANSFSVQKNDAAFVLDPNPLAHNVTEEESVFLASMLE